jgi:hypothetical protein
MAWSLNIAPAAAAWIAMTLVASAAPLTREAETPTGDVWITQSPNAAAPPQTARRTPVERALPTGDFWPAEDDGTRAADAPTLARDQSAAREDEGTGR